MPCVGSDAENTFLTTMTGLTPETCGWATQSNCIWLGLKQSITAGGAAEHWDSWYGTCTSTFRRWQVG